MTPEKAIITAICICLGGAVVTLLSCRRRELSGWLAFATTAASAGFALWAVAHVLTAGPSAHAAAFWAIPKLGFALRLHVDGLTSIFLLLTAIISVPAALYSISYVRRYPQYSLAPYYSGFLLLLVATYGLISLTDMMWCHCLFWQVMTLGGYVLIRFEHRRPESIRAANKYLVLTELGCAATMVAAALLAGGSGGDRYEFSAVSANLPALLAEKPAMVAVAIALFLVGFGIKMGMWPFGQLWIPDAYVALPAPMAAVASAVTSKTGVYGLMRTLLWLVPSAGWQDFSVTTWGTVVAVLGTITLFTGTMQALKQEQTQRLLAFHSIGQMGYILLGLGACLVVLDASDPAVRALAGIAFMGALLHAINHGLFKGLLFLNAGSMLHATGTQDLNKMGGLMKFMPLTAVTALIASFSISGVPLFNGFVSKWAIYTATIQAGPSAHYLPVCAIIAILTSALTLASFIKFFGTSFLSRASDLVLQRAAGGSSLEVGPLMRLPQVFLAVLCLLIGLMPALAFGLLQTALAVSAHGYGMLLAEVAPVSPEPGLGVAGLTTAVYAPLALAVVLLVMFVVAKVVSRLGRASRRAAEPWLCGYAREADCHRYVAHNFYGEIKRYFRWLGGLPSASAPKDSGSGAHG